MDDLLKLLRKNARFTNEELANMLDTTPEDIKTRIEEYEKSGIIKGYSVILNEEQMDSSAIIKLKVSPHIGSGFDEIARKIMQYDEVESLTLMSGDYDFIINLRGVNVKKIGLFVNQKLATIEGIHATATYFPLKNYKENGIIIPSDEDDDREYII